ncbi:MAG: chitobiase/beta-hexosaminidase C-terminal domain-containing protein, partial [Acidobacteriota bacterium]
MAAGQKTGTLRGNIHGGQQPVGGAKIQLYAVGTTGDGSASTPLLTTIVTSSDGSGNATNANANTGNGFNSFPLGEFSITLDYSCPSSSTQVYLTATGGDPGLGTPSNNQALALLAFLGPCGNLTANTVVNVNELTTVGSLAALGPYFGGLASIGSGPADAAQFLAALNLVSSYTNTSTGSVPGPDLAPGFYASTLEVTTLADILAACVNSDGTTAICQQLFSLATPSGQPAPTNTVDALGNILRNPTLNVAAIFGLLPATPPFQPTVAVPPANWALPILPIAAAPVISPASGSYSIAPQVTLSESTPGATLYYTVDGSTPTTLSSVYVGPFALTNSGSTIRTIKAIATAAGYGVSDVSSASYTLPPAGSAAAIGFLTQPVTSAVSTVLPPIKVGFVDAYGTPIAKSGKSITVAIGTNPVSGHLSGTLSAFSGSDGSATFSNLQIGTVGSGYTLTAASSGYATGTSAAFDITTPPIVLNLAGTLIGTSATLAGSFTLPTPAPAGGTIVTLTSSNTVGITISPTTVALNAGDTTGSFTYTAVGAGSTTLRAAAPTYTDGTANVSTTANFISFGVLPALPLGSFQNLGVTLSQPAPAGGLTVALSSSSPSVLYVSPTATFAAGATTPSNSVQLEGQAFGTSQLSGTAPGYAPDARTVTLTATTALTNVTVARNSAVSMKLTLSQAPSSSLNFTLKSDNTLIATVPSFVTLPAGQTTLNFNVTGAGIGSTVIRASAAGLSEATGTASVTGTLNVTNGSPAAMLFVPSTLNLASPAISPVSVTIASSNPAALLLSSDPNATGSASITLNNLTGSLATFYEQGQVAGTSTLTITSTFFSTVTSTVTVYNSTVLVQPGFTGTLSTTAAPATVYVTLGELNGSTYIGPCTGAATSGINATSIGCRLNPGLTLGVPVISGTPATGTITSSPVSFIAGQSNVTTAFQPVGGGTSLISVGSQPTGFTAPSSAVSTTFTATVAKPAFTLTNTGTYAAGVTTPIGVAPSITDTSVDGATVTVASGNGALALLSTDPAALGTPTLVLTGVHASLPTIYVQGITTGSTTLTISAPGYTTSSTTLNVTTGSVAFTSTATVNVNTADAPLAIGVLLNIGPGKICYSSGVTSCFLNPGINAQITLISANTAIATSVSPFTMSAGTGYTTGSVSGVGAGSTVLQITAASSPLVTPGFSYGPSQIGINVTQASVTAPAVITGSNLYSPQNFVLAPNPGSARPVTITSSNPAVAVISTSAGTLGSGTATVPNYTSGSVAYYVQGLSPGTSTLTIAAAGYTSKTSIITVNASGVVFSPTAQATFSTTSFSQPTTVGLYVTMLNSSTGALAGYCGTTCFPNPGATFSVPVTSSDTSVGTVSTSTVTFAAGATQASFTFIPGEVGTTALTLGPQPAGQTSSTGTANAGLVSVNGATITMPNVITGAGLYVSEGISLGAIPPGPATVTVSLSDPSLARLSTDPAVLGTGSTL